MKTTLPTAKTLALCADDHGLSAAVNRGIQHLAARGRLTDVSCLSNGPAWATGAPPLAALPGVALGTLRLGLHFNLTEGRPLSRALARLWPRLPTLPRLLVAAHLRQLPLQALRDELAAQWQAFTQATGRVPATIDGHQHVHHLPGLRDLVLERLAAQPGLLVRDTAVVLGPGYGFKRRVIAGTGARVLRRALQARAAQANTQLLGVYDFKATDYRALMQAWLAAAPPRGGLLFCHPGEAEPINTSDAIASARGRELAYLGSEDFAQDLAAAGVQLGHAV